MTLLQSANSLTSVSGAITCDSLNAAGHRNIDSAASITVVSIGIQAVRPVRTLHQTSMPSNRAGTRKPKMSRICAAPRAVRPDAGAAIAQDFVEIQITIARARAAAAQRKYASNALYWERMTQTANASETQAIPTSIGRVQPDTSSTTQSGPHASSRQTFNATPGSSSTLTKTLIHTQRHA